MIKFITFFFFILLSGVAAAAPDGKALFNLHCSACHGKDGKGGVGVPISLPSFINSVSDEYLKQTIRLGRPGRIMPAFPALSDAQINAIVNYVRRWSSLPVVEYDPTPVKGNNEHGQKIFLQHCAQCHGEDARGGKGTGVTFSRKRDLSIIAPALNNSGFLSSASDNMIRNTLIHGREGTPMQSSSAMGIKDSDVSDVVSYIRSLQKEETVSTDDEIIDSVIVVDSPYSLEETVESLQQEITNQNFKLIRTDYLEHGFVEEGKEDKKQVVLHFCNFNFLFKALAIDPRVGMFLPCRITVIEYEGKVQMMTINPMSLSRLFNNDELDEACEEMTETYESILEEVAS